MILVKNYRTLLSIVLLLIAGSISAQVESDPMEPLNRKIYLFNKITDSLYIKPATTAYENVLPLTARMSVSNFINNLVEVPTIINGLLQGKVFQALSDTLRFGVNGTLGLFGLFDVATQIGIPAHKEDLGKTFYAWGWKNSSFFVIPIIGPSTIRDALGIFGDLYLQVPSYFKPDWRNRAYFLALINRRQDLHEIDSIVGVAGVEYYNLVRSGYYQHRAFELNDRVVPIDNEDTPGLNVLGEPPD